MNAAQFYEEFKQALEYLGVGFRGMSEAEIECREGQVVMSVGKKEAVFPVPSKEAE